MRFLFLVQSMHGASTRYRVLQFLPRLQRAGIEVDVELVPPEWLSRRRHFMRASQYDLVFLQKRTVDGWLVRTLRKHAKRLVFDLDDAIWCGTTGMDAKHSRRRRARFRSVCRAADAVFAGNAYLADAAKAHAAHVHVMPTAINLERYPESPNYPAADAFTLGWIGSRSTLPYLEALAPAIDALADELPQLRLKIICDEFIGMDRVPVEKKPWASDDEAADLQSIDVGLMPLPDNAWTRGKCGFKILQYFAAWRPTISSPVGVNAEIVVHGENGMLADTPQGWQDAIRDLAAHRQRCRAMGEAGRARVSERYSLQAIAGPWVETLMAIAQ